MSLDIEKSLKVTERPFWFVQSRSDRPLIYTYHDRLFLFVHGYNSPAFNARKDYNKLKRNLLKYVPRLQGHIGFIFWPGHWDLYGLGFLRYPQALEHASECAEELAEYLHNWKKEDGAPTEIILIAHSLGCRLVLESLEHLASKELLKSKTMDQGRELRIYLMAAAVPVDAVSLDGHLSYPITHARSISVFYSQNDCILRMGFLLGQYFAEPHRRSPAEAVGLNGNPKLIWDSTIPSNDHGHGDYWSSEEVPQDILGSLAYPVPRYMHTRSIPQRPKLPSREEYQKELRYRW
jgi:esterase/lipase superfamily enzyme